LKIKRRKHIGASSDSFLDDNAICSNVEELLKAHMRGCEKIRDGLTESLG